MEEPVRFERWPCAAASAETARGQDPRASSDPKGEAAKGNPVCCQGGRPHRRDKLERAEKREFVATMKETLSGAGSIVVAQYTGLTVAEMTELRNSMREAGGTVRVAKNRLVKLALEGTDAEHMADLFKGPTLIAYAEDPVVAPKAASDFAKKNEKLVILGGAMGATNLDSNGVKSLASLPSLDELRGKLVGMINTPAQRIAMVTSAPAGQLARVIGAYSSKEAA